MRKKVALARVNYSQVYGLYGDPLEDRDIVSPYQLITVATLLRKEINAEVRIFDGEVALQTEEELVRDILKWNPDTVGFTSTTPDIVSTAKACMLVKEAQPNICTIIGGPHATAVPNKIKNVDIIAPGRFQLAYEAAHDLLDYSNYFFTDPTRGRMKSAPIMSTFGCPFSCKFCASDKKVKYKEVDAFIDEIVNLYEKHGVRYFYVYDDTFMARKDRFFQITKRIKEQSLDGANFQCLTRANLVTTDILDALKEANFVRVSMGIESGSNEILRGVNKGVTVEDCYKACSLLHSYDIETRGSFIIGLPNETPETIEQTIEFAKEVGLYHANFNILIPYPGTEVYRMALYNNGISFIKPEYSTDWKRYCRWRESVTRTPRMSGKEIEEAQKRAQVEFYTQPKIYEHHFELFKQGNKSKFFFRPLNYAWLQRFGEDIPFWKEL